MVLTKQQVYGQAVGLGVLTLEEEGWREVKGWNHFLNICFYLRRGAGRGERWKQDFSSFYGLNRKYKYSQNSRSKASRILLMTYFSCDLLYEGEHLLIPLSTAQSSTQKHTTQSAGPAQQDRLTVPSITQHILPRYTPLFKNSWTIAMKFNM